MIRHFEEMWRLGRIGFFGMTAAYMMFALQVVNFPIAFVRALGVAPKLMDTMMYSVEIGMASFACIAAVLLIIDGYQRKEIS
jgi:hypothetical protein